MKTALVSAIALLVLAAGCSAPLQRFAFDHPAMGTRFRLLLYADEGERAAAAAAAAFARIDALEQALSDWRDDSELARVTRAANAAPGTPIAIGNDLARVAARAQELAALCDGAFDITIGPLVQLWRRARRQGEPPSDAVLARARAATGFRQLAVVRHADRAGGTLAFARSGMALDLGAIAKGDALDEVLALLGERGLPCALLVGGGEVRAGAPPPGTRGWSVALSELADGAGHPLEQESDAPRRCVLLAHAALSTSGDLFRYGEIGGERSSHVIDPAEGLGLTRRVLAAVIAPDGATADALSTACGVAGPERALALVARVPGAVARIEWLEGGEVRACASPGWPPMMPAPVEARGEDDVDPFADPP
ncbi:MAG: FAD:protein FMN transferase [Planctomycetes bacterium]|nr:FAD:protein FMN transferase [Planctomycetota bacterium]